MARFDALKHRITKADCVVAQYEDGWYVEAAHPTRVESAISVAGPYRTEAAATAFVSTYAGDTVTVPVARPLGSAQ